MGMLDLIPALLPFLVAIGIGWAALSEWRGHYLRQQSKKRGEKHRETLHSEDVTGIYLTKLGHDGACPHGFERIRVEYGRRWACDQCHQDELAEKLVIRARAQEALAIRAARRPDGVVVLGDRAAGGQGRPVFIRGLLDGAQWALKPKNPECPSCGSTEVKSGSCAHCGSPR